MKKLSIIILSIFSLAVAFTACEKMEDIHSDFLADGDIIYAPKPQIIETYGGHNRIAMKYYLINAVNVTKCVIEWENGASSKTIDITPNVPIDSVEVILTDMAEKSYIFKVYTIDKFGNRSIKEQVTGSSYAELYMNSLTNRSITAIEGGGTTDSVVVRWGTPIFGNTGVEMMYTNRAGETMTKNLLPTENKVVIRDWLSESELSYRSFYIPEANAIDTFAAGIDKVMLPSFIEFTGEKIDKTNWEIVDFSTEEPAEGGGNGVASAAIDGDINTFWHTQWSGGSPGYPHFFTIDMKEIVKINQIVAFRRQGDARGQTRFEIHTSLDGVTYTSQGAFNYDPNANSQSYQLPSLPMARYVKYTALAGPNFFAFLGELDIYGQVATDIDRSVWTVTDFSSEEPAEGGNPNGLVIAAFDGNLSTFWHTAWKNSQPNFPHHFTIDMHKTVRMMAVECFRRQGNGNGQTKFKIYTSNDGENFEDQGTFDFNATINEGQMYPMTFLPEARYFKYEAIAGNKNYAFLAEIKVYGKVIE